MLLVSLILLAFFLNLPFGFYRAATRKFSVQWFLAIHLPIPFIFLARTYFGYSYTIIPLLLLAAVAGQMIGGKIPLKR